MSQPARAAWWPTVVAGLLLASGGGWLWRVLPHPPSPQPLASLAAPQPPAPSPRPSRLAPPPPNASPPPGRPGASVADSAAPPQRPRFTEQRRPAPRRYVGTVGGQPATAELSWPHPDSVSGRFYYWRGRAAYWLTSPAGRGTQELVVTLDSPGPAQASGQWQLSRPLGPLLQGTWITANGQRQPFVLREDYQGSAHYELLTSTLTLPVDKAEQQAPVYSHDFVHLLGPAARRLPLRRAQCPPRAGRRRFVRDFPHDGNVFCNYNIDITLNEFQLLGYRTWGVIDPFEGQNDWEVTYTLLDLTTGRELTLASQLRPGYARPLRRLLGAHLLASYAPLAVPDPLDAGFTPKWIMEHGRLILLAPLPGQDSDADMAYGAGMGLTAQGLAMEYSFGSDVLLLPYAELRPLVRPGTPLARLLAARGLW